MSIEGNVFESAPQEAVEVSEQEQISFADSEVVEADDTSAPRFASGTPAETAPALDPAGPPRPKGVSIDATAPTPAQPKPKAAPTPAKGKAKGGASKPKAAPEPQRVMAGALDGPVQRYGEKPDAVLESVKDIIAVPEKDGLPIGDLKTTKVVGSASCGTGCTRKFPIKVGWAGHNEHLAHETGRRVVLPGDHERTRERHRRFKIPKKYTWKQRDLDGARKHLKKSSKRINDLRAARKKIGDTPLAVEVVI